MDTEAVHKAVAGRWFTSFWGRCRLFGGGAGDLAVVDELAAPDVVLQYSMPGRLCGRSAVKGVMAGFRDAFPDLRFQRTGALIAGRDVVVVRWRGGGTHAGPAFHGFNLGPCPTASGRRSALSGHTAVRLEDGLIAEEAVWSAERELRPRPITGGLMMGLSSEEVAAE